MNTILLRTLSIESVSGKPITADIRYTDSSVPQPVVLVFHGFKGFKDWGFFPFVCSEFARRGSICVCMNFSLNGYAQDSDKVNYPDDFARNTISLEIEEARLTLRKIIDSFSAEFPQWNGEIYLLGHSRGGGIALLTGVLESNTVSKVVVWNSIGTFERFSERQKRLWRETGTFEVENSRTHQTLGMNVEFLNDIELHSKEFLLDSAAKSLGAKLLIIHGEQDMTVPVREAKKLAEINKAISVQLIANTGHTFGAVHPFELPTTALQSAIEHTSRFIGL
ncbi:MAG: alpha/beta hydrolase [Ignavibacteria bacterium]|nr:alpha/beta hydrolase [Ignavibacteria bacterium]